MTERFILALDQGTTSSRAILFDAQGRSVGMAQKELTQIYPQPGWVEQDPMEIWGTQSGVAREVLETTGTRPEQVAAIGITNQRETIVVWDRATGRPIHNAIGWQCRRTAALCEELKARGLEPHIRETTGLVLDSYFSGTKVKWILDRVEGARERARKGELLLGTIDTWLIWNLTRGRVHATDPSNAARTMLFNIKDLAWDPRILDELDIPARMLPEVRPSSGVFGHTDPQSFGGAGIPIASDAGDQQAALFGQACFAPGMAKNTYGTGCFLLMNTGTLPVPSHHGLLTTIAWSLDGQVEYALEGSVFVAGAAVQWLRDEMKMIGTAAESEQRALAVADNGGVYVVPGFVGLGAPHWDMYARGTIVGLTRGSGRDHIVRATLESIAFQTREVLLAMQKDSGITLKALKVDGGASANRFLMQFQADLLGVPVIRPVVTETTAMGAAFLAGLAVGFWRDREEIAARWRMDRRFEPAMDPAAREEACAHWDRAVERALGWAAR